VLAVGWPGSGRPPGRRGRRPAPPGPGQGPLQVARRDAQRPLTRPGRGVGPGGWPRQRPVRVRVHGARPRRRHCRRGRSRAAAGIPHRLVTSQEKLGQGNYLQIPLTRHCWSAWRTLPSSDRARDTISERNARQSVRFGIRNSSQGGRPQDEQARRVGTRPAPGRPITVEPLDSARDRPGGLSMPSSVLTWPVGVQAALPDGSNRVIHTPYTFSLSAALPGLVGRRLVGSGRRRAADLALADQLIDFALQLRRLLGRVPALSIPPLCPCRPWGSPQGSRMRPSRRRRAGRVRGWCRIGEPARRCCAASARRRRPGCGGGAAMVAAVLDLAAV